MFNMSFHHCNSAYDHHWYNFPMNFPQRTVMNVLPDSKWRETWGCPAASSPRRSAVARGGSWRWRGRWVWESWRCWRWQTEPRLWASGATSPTLPWAEKSYTERVRNRKERGEERRKEVRATAERKKTKAFRGVFSHRYCRTTLRGNSDVGFPLRARSGHNMFSLNLQNT